MKLDLIPMATWLWLAGSLLARAQAQGIEQALLAVAVERGLGGLSSAARLARFRRPRQAARAR